MSRSGGGGSLLGYRRETFTSPPPLVPPHAIPMEPHLPAAFPLPADPHNPPRYTVLASDSPDDLPLVLTALSAFLDRDVRENDCLFASNDALGFGYHSRLTVFHGLRVPTISIVSYLERIFKYANCSPACFVLAYVYVERLKQLNPELGVTSLNVHRVLITAVMVAAKFIDDAYFNNAFYAKVGGVTTAEMNRLELEFLFRINFNLCVTTDAFDKCCTQLSLAISQDVLLVMPSPSPMGAAGRMRAPQQTLSSQPATSTGGIPSVPSVESCAPAATSDSYSQPPADSYVPACVTSQRRVSKHQSDFEESHGLVSVAAGRPDVFPTHLYVVETILPEPDSNPLGQGDSVGGTASKAGGGAAFAAENLGVAPETAEEPSAGLPLKRGLFLPIAMGCDEDSLSPMETENEDMSVQTPPREEDYWRRGVHSSSESLAR